MTIYTIRIKECGKEYTEKLEIKMKKN